jgi:hypothetical protein
MTTFAGQIRLADGTPIDYSGEAPAKLRFLLGMTSGPGTPHNEMMAAFPDIAYTADFGKDGSDSDSLPELPNLSAGKFTNLRGATAHISWKDDPAQIGPWLSAAPANTAPFYLTWWHEPHGDISPADYRAGASKVLDILADHPRRDLVLGFGPAVTRYWLIDKGGNPADWWVDGMTAYFEDAYNDTLTNMTRYLSPAEQFTKVRDFARSKGVPWGVREWGKKRIASDTTGQGRCAAMRADVEWCHAQGDCLGMAWWNFGDTPPSSKIIGVEPEQTTFRQLLIQYGG